MNNVKEFKDYLVENEHSYLKSQLSSGRITMISGKWGSGKTHFWEKEIIPKLTKSIYISLFGKQKIQDIENEILTKSYVLNTDSNVDNSTLNKVASFYTLTKDFVSILFPKSGEKIEDLKNNIVNLVSTKFINENTVICFDDFERKSKNIDLNELFGFINQLTIISKCKTVIILNSEIFKGENKKIFIEVKEKTVSKYLHFEPTVIELYNVLFDNSFINLMEYKEHILEIFNQINLINARIILQVLNNLNEWSSINKGLINKKNCALFIFVNVNYILNHHVFEAEIKNKEELVWDEKFQENKFVRLDEKQIKLYVKNFYKENFDEKISYFDIHINEYEENYVDLLKDSLKYNSQRVKENLFEKEKLISDLIEFVDANNSLIQSWHFLNIFEIENYFESHNEAELGIFNNMTNFIKTGISKSVN